MKVRTQVLLATMAVVALATGTSVAYFLDRERGAAVSLLHSRLAEDARLLGVVTAGPLYDGNVAELNVILDSLFANPDVLSIELEEARGDIRLQRARPGSAAGEERIERETAVVRGADTLGHVRVSYSTASIDRRLAASRSALVGLSGVLMAALGLLAFFVAARLTRPIEQLRAAAQAMADGDLKRELTPGGASELEVLGTSFVRMRDAMREQLASLDDSNRQLREEIAQRERAEAEVRSSELRQRLAVQVAHIGIFDHDHIAGTIHWSPEQRAIYGVAAESPITLQLFLDHVHPDDLPRIGEAVERAHAPTGDGRFDVEHRIRRHDGEVRWVATRSLTVFQGEGAQRHPLRTVGAVFDITDRRHAENDRRVKAMAIATAASGIAISDANAQITYVNDTFVRMWGYHEASQVLGRTPGEFFVDPADAEAVMHAIAAEGYFFGEMMARRADGNLLFVECAASVVRDEAGQVTHMMGSFVDITLRKTQERALRESEARLAAAHATLSDAIESAPSAIAVFDADDRLIAHNSRLRELVRSASEHIRPGMGFRELLLHFNASNDVVEPPRAGTDWIDQRYRLHLEPAGPIELRLADRRWLQVVETRTQAGGIVTVCNDITPLKERESELRRLADELENRVAERTAELAAANRELESFASTVAHDLRAPLRGIDGFGKLLDDRIGASLDADSRSFLARMRASAQRMGNIIDALLKFSRIGRSEMRCRWVDLSLLAEAVADELKRTAPQRQVQWKIDPGLKAWADADLMHLVLENLLGNAFKYTSRTEQACIEFGARRDAAGREEFFVQDNGAGFDMAHAQMLFQPFRRLHGQHEFEGTGIGLATVGRIIQRHGGTLSGEGAVGKGAVFRFTLPRPDRAAES